MFERWTPVIATAVLAFAQALPVPSEPDFSGKWRLVSSPLGANAAETMTVEQPVTRADVYGKPMKPFYRELLVTREFANGPRTEMHRIGVIGGRVPGMGPGHPRVEATEYWSVRWEGRTLAIENGRHTGQERRTGEWDERREEWSFDTDGRLRIVITTYTSQSPAASSVTHLYQRR